MCETRFFKCEKCGNMVGLIHNAGVPMMCCKEKMHEMVPNNTEASEEKHMPAVSVEGDKVCVSVGDVPHPMTEEHHIVWVYLQTDRGGHRKCIKIGDEPKVCFMLYDENPCAVYAYCDVHGLWKKDI